jgi:hypothetical protein
MFRSFSLFGAATLAACFFNTSAEAATYTVNCASAKIQPTINAAPAGTPNTITVSGACVENITIPYGKQFTLVGAAGSSLKPKDLTAITIVNNGWLTLLKMNVQSTGTAASLIQTVFGRTEITASTLKAASVTDLLDTGGSSSLLISNSSITGGTGTAISLTGGATGIIVSDISRPVGTAGPVTTISTGNTTGDAIWCGPTANLRLRSLAGSTNGVIKITNSLNGIDASGCTAEIQNKTGVADNVTISGMSNNGVFAKNSNLSFWGVRISSNTNKGIGVFASSVLLTASKIYASGSNDISAGFGAQVLFNWGPVKSSLPDAIKAPYDSLTCTGNTEISIPKVNLVENLGTYYDMVDCIEQY